MSAFLQVVTAIGFIWFLVQTKDSMAIGALICLVVHLLVVEGILDRNFKKICKKIGIKMKGED